MSSRLTDIHDLYAYDAWARRRVLEAASALGPEQLTRQVGGSFPSVLETLAHILKADWIWLSRWKGASPTGWPAEWPLEDLASVASHWRRVAAERKAWLATLTEADLDRDIDYRNTQGEPFRSRLGEMLRHVVNHASYHRGQVTNQIRAAGGQPVATDLIRWARERGETVAPHALPS